MPNGPIVGLQFADLAQLESLLRANHLPTEDCLEQAQFFYGIFNQGELVAAGGLEPAANFALLRSVVVREQNRAQGLARDLCRFLIELAESEGRESIYLLTETAEAYFEDIGFNRVDRDQVPTAITQTRQFASLCPDSASCLVMHLRSH